MIDSRLFWQEVLHVKFDAHQASDDAKATLRLLLYMIDVVFPQRATRGVGAGAPAHSLIVGMRQVVGRIRWLRHQRLL